MTDLTAAHANLETTLEHLQAARQAVLQAEDQLTGARHARCTELTDKLSDAIAFCWRPTVVVEGDLRCENLAMGGQ
jgi:hypothetical protein